MNPLNVDPAIPGKVAIYWDFENFHATLADRIHGAGAYRENGFSSQPRFFKIDPVIEYAASYGDVIINKAYNNWQWFGSYRHMLNIAGVDLIQMFPRGKNMKNSADIRLALDVLSDIHYHPHITHVVVVSSDSDFISLAQKIKQAGKFIAGVGVSGYSNKFWVASCNEFKFYDSFVRSDENAATKPAMVSEDGKKALPQLENESMPTMEEARSVLQRAMVQLVERNGDNRVAKGGLKSIIKRLMPSFDEHALQCGSFSGFILKCSDIVRVIDEESGGHVALVDYAVPASQNEDTAPLLTKVDPSEVEDSSSFETPSWPVPENLNDSEEDSTPL